MSTSFKATRHPVVTSPDASPYGVVATERELGPGLAGELGRSHERWRYLCEEAIAARKHALGPEIGPKAALDVQHQDFLGRLTDARFAEISPEPSSNTDWKVAWSQLWGFDENILRLEARAMLWSLQHKLCKLDVFGSRHIALVDNMPLALATRKGRACSYHFLKPLGRVLRVFVSNAMPLGRPVDPQRASRGR
jgi:hypothetical protein